MYDTSDIEGYVDFKEVLKEKQKYARIFSEGCPRLKDLLLKLWDVDIETLGCCAGHDDDESYRQFSHINLHIPYNQRNLILAFAKIKYLISLADVVIGKDRPGDGLFIEANLGFELDRLDSSIINIRFNNGMTFEDLYEVGFPQLFIEFSDILERHLSNTVIPNYNPGTEVLAKIIELVNKFTHKAFGAKISVSSINLSSDPRGMKYTVKVTPSIAKALKDTTQYRKAHRQWAHLIEYDTTYDQLMAMEEIFDSKVLDEIAPQFQNIIPEPKEVHPHVKVYSLTQFKR